MCTQLCAYIDNLKGLFPKTSTHNMSRTSLSIFRFLYSEVLYLDYTTKYLQSKYLLQNISNTKLSATNYLQYEKYIIKCPIK